MANFTITTQNRSAARRMLNAWHDSRDVRLMTLAQLQSNLQLAINEGLLTEEGCKRALVKREALQNDSPNQGGENNLGRDDDVQELDDEIGAHAAQGDDAQQDDNAQGDAESGDAEGEVEKDWDDALDDAQAGDGDDGNADDGDGDGEDDADDMGAQSEDGEDDGEDGDDGEKDESEKELEEMGDKREDAMKELNDAIDEDDDEETHDDEDEAEQEQQDREESEDDDAKDREDDKDEEQDEDADPFEQMQKELDEDEEDAHRRNDAHDDRKKKHKMFPVILKYIRAGLNVALVGPAGTGKSTIAQQVAKELDLEFRSTGALMSKYDLVGYKDATGQYHDTPLYESFTSGCLFCFDEMDGSSPDAVVSFNAVTDDQGCFAFPNGMQYKHDKFVAIACLNTWGNGATADYVGRFKQDAASMSRFVRVFIDYDENIEIDLGPADIVDRVWKLRAACTTLGIRHIVSTRMIIFAAKSRAGGVTRREIDRDIFFAGLDEGAMTQVKSQMRSAS